MLRKAVRQSEATLQTPCGAVIQLLGVVARPSAGSLGGELRSFVLRQAQLVGVQSVCGVTRCREWTADGERSYADHVEKGSDRGLRFHLNAGARMRGLVAGYRPEDTANEGHGVLIEYCLGGAVDEEKVEREDIASSPETSSDLAKFCAGGLTTGGRAAYDFVQRAASDLADGHPAYDLVPLAASNPAAEFWERWASQELHWFHEALGAWLSQSTDGGWTGWNVDGSPTTLDSWQPWEAAVDASEAPHVRWFCGARTNAAFNEIDRHVLRGHGEEVAFIAESPSGETTRITRRWLLLHSILIAHALQNGLHITAPQRIALCRWRVKRRLLQK